MLPTAWLRRSRGRAKRYHSVRLKEQARCQASGDHKYEVNSLRTRHVTKRVCPEKSQGRHLAKGEKGALRRRDTDQASGPGARARILAPSPWWRRHRSAPGPALAPVLFSRALTRGLSEGVRRPEQKAFSGAAPQRSQPPPYRPQ